MVNEPSAAIGAPWVNLEPTSFIAGGWTQIVEVDSVMGLFGSYPTNLSELP